MASLLEQAKNIPVTRIRRNREVTKQEIDLLFGYLRAEITMAQMNKILFEKKITTNKTNVAAWYFRTIETAYKLGRIQLI